MTTVDINESGYVDRIVKETQGLVRKSGGVSTLEAVQEKLAKFSIEFGNLDHLAGALSALGFRVDVEAGTVR